MSYGLVNNVRWSSADEAAFWASWPTYDAALPDAGRAFYTGFDPSKVPAGEPMPPTIQEISRVHDRARNVKSRIHAQDFPYALPLGALLRKLGSRVPADVSLLAQQHSPYLLVYGIDVEPADGERITRLRIRLDYADDRQFITHSLAPETELEERYKVELTAEQGVDLSLRIAVPTVELIPGVEISPGVKTDLHGSMLLHWQHRRLRASVLALGVRRRMAEWKFNDAEELAGRVDLRMVVLAPKRARRLDIAVAGEFGVRIGGLGFWRRETSVEISAQPVRARLMPVNARP